MQLDDVESVVEVLRSAPSETASDIAIGRGDQSRIGGQGLRPRRS